MHVERFVVECHEQRDVRAQAEMRINGIDPDNFWTLEASFDELEPAELFCGDQTDRHARFSVKYGIEPWKTFRVRDTYA